MRRSWPAAANVRAPFGPADGNRLRALRKREHFRFPFFVTSNGRDSVRNQRDLILYRLHARNGRDRHGKRFAFRFGANHSGHADDSAVDVEATTPWAFMKSSTCCSRPANKS